MIISWITSAHFTEQRAMMIIVIMMINMKIMIIMIMMIMMKIMIIIIMMITISIKSRTRSKMIISCITSALTSEQSAIIIVTITTIILKIITDNH